MAHPKESLAPAQPMDDAQVDRSAELEDSPALTAKTAKAHAPRAAGVVAVQPVTLLDRDHSILAFNERVLDWAVRDDVPLLERLRFLCIVSSNLDEFFEVRAEPHVNAVKHGETEGLYTVASFEALAAKVHDLVARQYALYNQVLVPAFAAHGIRILAHSERSAAHKRWVSAYFRREVRPLLVPVGLDPAHPFPQVANKSLNVHRAPSRGAMPSGAKTRSPSSRCRARCRASCASPATAPSRCCSRAFRASCVRIWPTFSRGAK